LGNIDNDKLNKIIQLLDEGYSTTEIAGQLGYKHRDQVSQFLRRSGYRWDKNKKKFTLQSPDQKEASSQINNEDVKPERIINDFKNGNDPKRVAKNNGFTDYLEMALYMKNKGYAWNDHIGNYEFLNQEDNILTGQKEPVPAQMGVSSYLYWNFWQPTKSSCEIFLTTSRGKTLYQDIIFLDIP